MTTYDATGNVRQPTFEEIRHLFLAVTKDGDPAPLPTDIPPDDPRYPKLQRIIQLRKQAWETYREIICVAATGKRYLDLEQSAKMILQSTKTMEKSFAQYLKAFLALVSIHTYATPRRSDPEQRPILRLTEEFWSKEWVPLVFVKLREFDAKHKNPNLIAKTHEAIAKGATGAFVSKKTVGYDIITYIAMNTPRWEKERKSIAAIQEELVSEGYEMTDSIFNENVRKAKKRYGQYFMFFDRGDRK
jgi:hypothetical protein